MRAVIYARKSQAQDDTAEELTSVERQIAGAREWIASRGWELVEVFTDPGVSGALFAGRPGFQHMLAAAERGEFECVVLYALDRFGRDGRQTMEALHRLADLGVAVWDFSTGQVVDLDSFEGRITATLRAEFAAQERERARKRTRDALRDRAAAGKPTGRVAFGYRAARDEEGNPSVVPGPGAEVVREIFRRFATGEGFNTIARWLNTSGRPSPLGRVKWSSTTVRFVIRNPIYRGEKVWGVRAVVYGSKLGKPAEIARGKKAGVLREKGQKATRPGDWIRTSVPQLRLIDPDTSARVDARLRELGDLYAQAKERGRAPQKAHGHYLLSGGMLICPQCGGNFEARHGTSWGGRGVYVCGTRRRNPGVCSNKLVLPIVEMDAIVLHQLEDEVLSPRYINQLVSLVGDAPDETERLTADKTKLQVEIGRLLDSIAEGVPARTVAPKIKEREAQIAKLEVALRRPRPVSINKMKLRPALEQKTAEWREVLRGEPRVARLLLRRLIGPITLWEDEPTPAVPEEYCKYISLPEHLRPKGIPHWSNVPGEVPAPGASAPSLRWEAEFRGEGLLESLPPASSSTARSRAPSAPRRTS
jgi:DNA invertase Pin-like site-specific DNA recombinase